MGSWGVKALESDNGLDLISLLKTDYLPKHKKLTLCGLIGFLKEEDVYKRQDFFTVTRLDAWGTSTWFMCTPEAAKKLVAMDYDKLSVRETTIVG